MPINKKQLKRMVLFIGEVKTKRYPNSYSFSDYLRKIDIDDNIDASCTPRTIQRDIQALKNDFNAPLKYDYKQCGYYLDSQYWEFSTPLLGDMEILGMVLGCRLAENIFPEPLKGKIKYATAQQLSSNTNEILASAYLDSLMVCSAMTVNINSEIFGTVFDAWKNSEALDIVYTNAKGKQTSRRIDPHILAFQDGAWFIKAYCHLKNKVWIFSVHRLNSAKKVGKFFESNKSLIDDVRKNGLFNLARLDNIVLRCENKIINYVKDYEFHPDQYIKSYDKDSFDLHIPSAARDQLIRWIMWQAGQAIVVKPVSLSKEIANYAEKLFTKQNLINKAYQKGGS